MGMAKTNQTIAKAMGCFPQPDSKGHIAEDNTLTTSL